MREKHSRRTFLGAALTVGGVSIGYPVVAQDAQPDFELGGRVSGWQGVAPSVIEGNENPTLTLLEGADYVLEWSNLDGRGHNFTVQNADGEDLLATDIIVTGTQTVEFTASAEMDEYYCQPHPQSMRGSLVITDDPQADGIISPERGEQMQEGDQDQEQEIDEEPTETFEFALTEQGWMGRSPDAIAGRTDPTLQLASGDVYEVVATTDLAREAHQTGHSFTIINEAGQEVANTGFFAGGGSASVRFVADDELACYIDQTQLDVGGGIEVNGDGTQGGG